MKTERATVKQAVYLVIFQDDKVLLSRRKDTGYRDGEWGFPSGHVEPDEFPSEAVAREGEEEINIVPQKFEWVHTMYRKKEGHTPYVDLFFIIAGYSGQIQNKEPNKCARLEWFPLDQLPSETIPYIALALNHISNHIPTSEFLEPLA